MNEILMKSLKIFCKNRIKLKNFVRKNIKKPHDF